MIRCFLKETLIKAFPCTKIVARSILKYKVFVRVSKVRWQTHMRILKRISLDFPVLI